MFEATAMQGRPALFTWSLSSRRLACAAGAVSLFAAGASIASASLWENNDWALIGDLSGSVTYDSNIFAFEGGEGDTVFGVTPALTLQRKGSASDIEIVADAKIRRFVDLSDQNSTDPSIAINFTYPNTGEALIRQRARLTWYKLTYPDYAVGNRVERTELSGNWQGVLRDNGKTKIIARLDGSDLDYTDFESDVLNLGGGIGLAWSRTELFEYTLTVDYDHSEYSRETGNLNDITRKGYRLNIGARGEFTPKISGSASVGIGRNEYSGDLDGSDNDWSTSADVSWRPSERRSLTLNASRGTSFDALGQAYNRLEAGLSFRQGMSGGFAGVLRGSVGEYDFSDTGSLRKDKFIRLGAGVDYNLTGRFSAGLHYNWTDRTSDTARYEFSQYEIAASASYRF